MMYTLKLRYSELLLSSMRRRASRSAILREPLGPGFDDLCDRFERVMRALPSSPLVWEGDYA